MDIITKKMLSLHLYKYNGIWLFSLTKSQNTD